MLLPLSITRGQSNSDAPSPRELLDSIALTDVAFLVNSQQNDGAVVSRIRRKVVDFLLLQGGDSLDVRHQQ